MKIIIDAMGGDFAPEAPVRGALLAREKYGADIILTGRTADILRELEKAGCKEVPQGIEIANAEEVVEICDDPATAFKQKKDSSLTVGLNLLRDGQADGFISAGSTGALLAGATLVVKRIRGLRRAALAPTIPTMTGRMHERVPAAICLLRQLLCRKGARRRATARRTFEYRRRAEQGRRPPP